jgi:hypothetical protein
MVLAGDLVMSRCLSTIEWLFAGEGGCCSVGV